MKYTLEVPDQDAEFVLEVLRRLASVKLTPASRKPTSEADPAYLMSNRAARDQPLEAKELLEQVAAKSQSVTISAEERARRFEAVVGSWQSEESGDELNQQLRAARYFRDRDVEL